MSATGRHVKHSRNGCVVCKKRRLRCPGEKPSCSRCTVDGKQCEYILQLQWEDDNLRRGVKHGRSQTTKNKVLAGQLPISGLVKHFVNFDAADFGERDQPEPAPETRLALKARRSGSSLLPTIQPSWYMESALDATLYDYYINRVCHHATLLDDTSNLYRRLVLPMSMSQDSIRHLILSLGALALATEQTGSTSDLQAVALRHKQKSFQHLRRDLSQPDLAMSDHNLVAVQLMCVLDIADNCQVSWATHLSAAKTLVELQRNGRGSPRSSDVVDFVSKFFVLKDSLGRSACGNGPKFQLPSLTSSDEIDVSTGCSYKLIKIISDITDLSRAKGTSSSQGYGQDAWQENRKTLADRLTSLTQILPEPPQRDETGSQLLIDTASFYQLAANIYFYTALMPQALHVVTVEAMVLETIAIMNRLHDRLRSQHLWPIFVTALFVANEAGRVVVLDAFTKIQQESPILSAGAAEKALHIVQAVWKKNDLEGTLSYSNTWNGVVRQMSEGLSLG